MIKGSRSGSKDPGFKDPKCMSKSVKGKNPDISDNLLINPSFCDLLFLFLKEL